MKFLGFSKIWRRNSQNIFHFKIFFFSRENIFQEISSQILENPKNFMISFFHPLSFNGKNLWPNFHFRFSPEYFVFPQSVSFFPKIKHFFSPKQNEIFGTSSGRTQDVFPFFSRGRKSHRVESGKPSETFWKEEIKFITERRIINFSTSPKKIPFWSRELKVKNSFPWKEIQTKLVLSPTRFLNQIKSGKFAKKIDWISDELFFGEKPTGEEIR